MDQEDISVNNSKRMRKNCCSSPPQPPPMQLRRDNSSVSTHGQQTPSPPPVSYAAPPDGRLSNVQLDGSYSSVSECNGEKEESINNIAIKSPLGINYSGCDIEGTRHHCDHQRSSVDNCKRHSWAPPHSCNACTHQGHVLNCRCCCCCDPSMTTQRHVHARSVSNVSVPDANQLLMLPERPSSPGYLDFNQDSTTRLKRNGIFLSVQNLHEAYESQSTPASPAASYSEDGGPSRKVSTVTLSGQQSNFLQIPTDNGPMVLQLVLPQHSGGQYMQPGLGQAAITSASSSSSSPMETMHTPTITETYDSMRTVGCSGPTSNNNTTLVKHHGQKLSSDGHQPSEATTTVRAVPLQPLPTTEEEKSIVFKKHLATLLSCIYAIFFVMLGGVIYVSDILLPSKPYAEVFTIYLTIVGLTWLSFLQFDIRFYLTRLSKWRKQEKRKSCAKDNDGYQKSPGDEVTNKPVKHVNEEGEIHKAPPDAYCFKTGPHSGSFYLKIGAAGFCFGHLIHEGLLLSRQILYFTSGDVFREQCSDIVGTIHQVLHPIFSFYQLFIIFKYSNIIINRHREVARFAIMHIIAANLCLWVNTIIRETVDSLNHNMHELEQSSNSTHVEQWMTHENGIHNRTHINAAGTVAATIHTTVASYGQSYYNKLTTGESTLDVCLSKTILSAFTIQASPYLYPFTIEYSLLQVGIWFVIWYNIGNLEGVQTESEKTRAALDASASSCMSNGVPDDDDELCLGESGHFSSNLVIHVDCHSANRGLFAGLFILLATVVSVIIFFVAMTNRQYTKTGVIINNVSDAVLLVIMILSVLFAYRQTAKLDINLHANPFLDDFLLFIALPCFFLYAIFNIVAGIAINSPFNVVISMLSVIQVVVQTPFIIDGLRRCSNSYLLRYKKPGRELVTFLVVCNIASWILETFEIKSHETHSDKAEFYGSFLWTLLSHITLPLTLFYRFHSSVCLVDMWKSAYEPGDVQ